MSDFPQPTTVPRQGLSHVPRPLDYDGVSHARMTRRMTQAGIPPAARVIMAEIFRCVPVGRWRHISHATLSRRLGLSESTVSRGVALLTGETLDDAGLPINRTPFIARRRRQDGRPGYEICPLPPPELRPHAPAHANQVAAPVLPVQMPLAGDFDPSTSDPAHAILFQPVPMPQSDPREGSLSDPSLFLDHACSGSKHGDPPSAYSEPGSPSSIQSPPPAAASSTPADLPADPPAQLAALGIRHSYQWRALVAAAPPGYDLPALTRDLLKLRGRPDVARPVWLLRRLLERGEPIYSLQEIEAHNAELAALTGRALPKEASDDPAVPTPAPGRRPADAPPERVARPGPRRPTAPAQPPALSRAEFAELPTNAAAAFGVPLPRRRYAPGRDDGGGDGPADHRGPLRE